MVKDKLIQDGFWKNFKDYSNDKDLKFNLDNPANSSEEYPNSYMLFPDKCSDIKHIPNYITVRINTRKDKANNSKNTLSCKVRFGFKMHTKYSKEEIEFFNYLFLKKDSVCPELCQGIKDKTIEDVIWESKKTEPQITRTLRVDYVFDEDKREEYLEWLDSNARLFKQVLFKYYKLYIQK